MITDLRTLRLDGVDMLVSVSGDRVEVRDPRNDRLISSQKPGEVHRLVVCEVGWRDPVIAAGTDRGVVWLDPRTGHSPHTGDPAPPGPLATWAGTLLAGSPLEPFPLLRWDAGTGARLEPLGVHADQVSAVAVLDLPDGPVVCAGDQSGTIHRWHPRTGARAGDPLTVGDEPINAITGIRLPGGRRLIAAATADLHRWDAATGEPIGVPVVVDSHAVHRLDPVVVNGRVELITSGHDEVVQRWDAETGERIGAPLPGRCATVFHRYGELTLAIGSPDGAVALFPLGQPHPDRRT
ncbi:WD40 repeat domain-containing protein [Actinoplanes oblitus]|uniref:WD40 repeat domain-containing protein n=1 Tax=Actinoplanes oblitus TaxID=3040509 RepID=A0ABY8WAS2_9ACTN|nr:WD40 repeat domain-containing protein [Actinoplanes oblitus]WIM94231.1 WD40 repeat domain-containing protein [Actinoplanes oblitus]